MRLIGSFIVAVILLLGVTYWRYGEVYSQMSRDELEISRTCAANTPRPSYDGGGIGSYANPAVAECERQAREIYHLGDGRRYLFGAWLWGAIAALLGAVVAFVYTGRRKTRLSGEPGARPAGLGR